MLAVLLSGCDKEAVPPTVELLAPRDGFKADVGDTLKVRLRAEAAEKGLHKGSLVLLDNAHRQALPSKSFGFHGEVKAEEKILYPIDQEAGGKGSSYDLKVTVEGKNGETNTAFAEGQVTGKPRKLEKAFVVMHPIKDRVKVFAIKELQKGPELFKDLQTDYSGSASSSLHSELLIAGSHTGDLRAFDAATGQQVWSVPNQGAAQYPYFLDLESEQNGEWVLAPLGTERLEGYRGGSGPDLTAEALDAHFMQELALIDGRILSEQEPIGSDPRQWVTYYASTGAIGTQKQIPQRDIVRILPGDPGNAIVLANVNGQGKLLHYDIQGRFFQELATPPSGLLKHGVRMGGGRVLLVHSQGLMIYKKGSSLFRELGSVVPQAIAYDDVSEQIYSAEGEKLRVRDTKDGTVQWEHAFNDSVRDLHLLYDR